VEIRRADGADPSDAAALGALRYEWRAGEAGETMDAGGFAEAFAAWLRSHKASHLAFLAVTGDGEPVGMAFLAVVERIPGPDRWERRSGNVQSVYVRPRHRGHGTGTLLCGAVIAEARRLGLDYLVVHPSRRSFPVYRRLGFAEREGALELDLRPAPGPGRQGATPSTGRPSSR
jgi:GNAT superfamily N-acetyltransferase